MIYSLAQPATPQTPSTGLRNPSPEEGAGKRCSECAHTTDCTVPDVAAGSRDEADGEVVVHSTELELSGPQPLPPPGQRTSSRRVGFRLTQRHGRRDLFERRRRRIDLEISVRSPPPVTILSHFRVLYGDRYWYSYKLKIKHTHTHTHTHTKKKVGWDANALHR